MEVTVNDDDMAARLSALGPALRELERAATRAVWGNEAPEVTP